ncbi:MAG: NAD(P)H-binding protein [Pseudomonadales bacterium]|jgi:NAD(P)H dehydrogenase (quinone)|tara:strand:+ start:5203 stop:6072 length:870 start_codon:yes stop_codon:yes gene_type:complete
MKIAVSAASGRLGHAIISELLTITNNSNIIAIVRDPVKFKIEKIETRIADYQSLEEMDAALQGVDTLLMISAPVAGSGDRLQLHSNVIKAAVSAGVGKLIYTSIISNGGEANTLFSDFASINQRTEEHVKCSGMEWIIARNGLYLDLDVAQIRAAANADGLSQNNGNEGRCGYISISELAYAYAQLATNETCNGKTLNLTGPCYTQSELVDSANKVYDIEVIYQPISFEDNIKRLRDIPLFATRGHNVINMLGGCFQCIEQNVFDVPSDYLAACGREPLPLYEQMKTFL